MPKTAEEMLSRLKGRTNINNTNNDNNDNNLITSIIVPSSNDRRDLMSSTSLLASSASPLPVPEGLVTPLGGSELPAHKIGDLPPTWQSVKIDLFCNGINARGRQILTLKLGIIPKGQTKPVEITAQLNSPIRHIYRGVAKEDLLNPHWLRVKKFEQENRKQIKDLRGSKFYIEQKSGSIEELVGWVYNEHDYWCLSLIKSGELFEYLIEDEGSTQFRKNNGIATSYYAETGQGRRWISQKELGI
jgi:hypothetical protein